LEDEFTYQIAELGWLAMLGMLACAEAALRVDMIERVHKKKRDDVSRRFRVICKEQRNRRIRFEEDVLDTWAEHGPGSGIKKSVAAFKGALPLRHWLAHGRYWKPKLGRAAGYNPADIFDICKVLLQAVGLMPPDVEGT
jgi:hypothetical protein